MGELRRLTGERSNREALEHAVRQYLQYLLGPAKPPRGMAEIRVSQPTPRGEREGPAHNNNNDVAAADNNNDGRVDLRNLKPGESPRLW